MLETVRECLQDVFDLPALRSLLADLQARRVDLVAVETPTASPFASSLVFEFVATSMYEDDTPLAERRAQALALDRDLLRELLGQEELRDLLDADALEQVEEELRGRRALAGRAARPAPAPRRPRAGRVRRGARRAAPGRAARGGRPPRREATG